MKYTVKAVLQVADDLGGRGTSLEKEMLLYLAELLERDALGTAGMPEMAAPTFNPLGLTDLQAKAAFVMGWNRCRDAMIAAAQRPERSELEWCAATPTTCQYENVTERRKCKYCGSEPERAAKEGGV